MGTVIRINGYPTAAGWGAWSFDLPTGTYQIDVCTRLVWNVGHARMPVCVTAGCTTTIYYRAPLVLFVHGAIGYAPPKAPGFGALIAVIALPVVVMVAWLVILALD